MYSFLIAPCFTSSAKAARHANENETIRQSRLAEVRALIADIAAPQSTGPTLLRDPGDQAQPRRRAVGS